MKRSGCDRIARSPSSPCTPIRPFSTPHRSISRSVTPTAVDAVARLDRLVGRVLEHVLGRELEVFLRLLVLRLLRDEGVELLHVGRGEADHRVDDPDVERRVHWDASDGEGATVVAHDQCGPRRGRTRARSSTKPAGLDEALGVRPVGAEQHVVDADQVGEAPDVVLVERRHPDVAAERLDRVAGEGVGDLLVELGEPPEQLGHPARPALDGGDPHARVAGEHAVDHERAERLHRRPVGRDERAERVEAERLHLAAGAPVVGVAAVAGVARVVADGDAGLVDHAPEPGRTRGRRASGRRTRVRMGAARRQTMRAPASSTRAQLGLGLGRVGERQHRRGEDAVVVGVAPVVLEPAVEGPEAGVQGVDVVGERLLEPDAERREEEAAVEPLGVHDGEAGVAVAVLGAVLDALEVAEGGPDVAGGLLAPEVDVERPGPGDGVERRVRDEAADACPPTRSRFLPSIVAHCTPRLRNAGSR